MSTESPDALLLNRELSLLKFNERVLEMAENHATPLLERLRYLCIVSSNLDEFFEIRISSLKEQQRQTPNAVGQDGFTPGEAFERVQHAAHELIERQNSLLIGKVLPKLRAEGIDLMEPATWSEDLYEWAHDEFYRSVMPMLTPIGLDPAHPFPRVYNKSLNFIVALAGQDAFGRRASIAIVQAPRALPRVMKVPAEIAGIPHGYILLSALISAFVGEIFPGLDVKGVYQWRVTRNSDLFVDEEEITNLRQALQGELSQRNFGAAVRLEIDHTMPQVLESFLQQEFLLQPQDTYRVSGPVNLSRLMQLGPRNCSPPLRNAITSCITLTNPSSRC
jgi:polyphosphate kinase